MSFEHPPSSRPENPFISPASERRRDVQDFEIFFDQILGDLLERHAEKINEGNNGVIFRLDIQNIDASVLEVLHANGIDFDGGQVVKILKFGAPGQGKAEFALQSEAFRIIQENGRPEVGRVPRPVACRDIKVDAVMRDRLLQKGVRVEGDHVELQIMDEIRGEDLATVLYKEVIRRHPKTVHLVGQLDAMSFMELQDAVTQALGFAQPGGKARNEQERDFEKQRVLSMNAKVLYGFLARQDVRFHPAIAQQIRSCMQALHEAGFAHRDAHHRNIMIEGDHRADAAVAPTVYVIDFGSAAHFTGDYATAEGMLEDREAGVVKKYLNDLMVAEDLEQNFSKTQGEKTKGERLVQLAELLTLREKLLKSAAGKAFLGQAAAFTADTKLDLTLVRSPNPKLKTFLILMQEGLSQGTLQPAQVRDFLKKKQAELIPADGRLVDAVLASFTA